MPILYQGDLTTVAKNLSATEAVMLCDCLQAAGIEAHTADTNLVQTNARWVIALGGDDFHIGDVEP